MYNRDTVIIGGLQKTTLIDYPGKIACTVFLAVCNFRCPWCYSSELVLPEKIIKQPRISENTFFTFLKERQGLLDGVVICGGEPTINKDLPQFIEKIKSLGYFVKLDTNGSNPETVKNLIDKKLIDYVAMDIKAPLGLKSQTPNSKSQTPARNASHSDAGGNSKSQIQNLVYQKIIGEGIKLEDIKKSVEILKKGDVDFEFRTTVVPGAHAKEDFLEIAKWIGGPNVKYYLQNFKPEKTLDPEFEKVKPYPDSFLEEIGRDISPFFKECRIR